MYKGLYLRILTAVLLLIGSWYGASSLHAYLDPNQETRAEQSEDRAWIATSTNVLDRWACRYLGLCGIAHWRPDPPGRPWRKDLKHKDELYRREQHILDGSLADADLIDLDRPTGPEDLEGDERVLKEIPTFVLDHAPLVHLYSKEEFWPSDIAEHLLYMTPYLNYTLQKNESRRTLDTLGSLNDGHKVKHLFMHSLEDVEQRPAWLSSTYNKPVPYEDDSEAEKDEEIISFVEARSSLGKEAWFDSKMPIDRTHEPLQAAPRTQSFRPTLSERRIKKRQQSQRINSSPGQPGFSQAPAVLVVVDKGSGILDAFWFYFYSYNLGTTVLNMRFGNHVGDWEHSMIRFHHGVPKAIFFSAHSGGTAYTYSAVEKGHGPGREGRPILYSAFGSHAMYAMPGKHPYILPFGILADVTDRGPLWDPSLNYYAYHFNTSITHDQDAESISSDDEDEDADSGISWPSSWITPYLPNPTRGFTQNDSFLEPAAQTPNAPISWFWYGGHWGDKFYQLVDIRQWRFVGQAHYVNGPLGPRYKTLGRATVCANSGKCTLLESLRAGKKASWNN